MRFLVFILLVIFGGGDINKIARINQVKNQAQTAYASEDFPTAISAFKLLIDSLEVEEDPIFLNLANAYYKTSDTSNAAYYYTKLFDSDNGQFKSLAYQQMGVIEQQKNKHEVALNHFKEALKANPENEDARFNYELLKKMMDQQKQKDQDKQSKGDKSKDSQDDKKSEQQKSDKDNQNSSNKDQQDQEENKKKKEQQQKDQENQEKAKDAEKTDEPMKTTAKKLEEMKLTEEAARMILEAMKNNEIQYIQQNRRKATQKPDNNKPDW